jgi:hypothetical protein
MGSLEEEIAAQDARKAANAAQNAAQNQMKLDTISECAQEFAVAARNLSLPSRTYEGTVKTGWNVHVGGSEGYHIVVAVLEDGSWRPIIRVLKKRMFGRESYEDGVGTDSPIEKLSDNPNAIRANFASQLREYRDAK